MQQIEHSIDRYMAAMDSADRATPEVAEAKAERLKQKIETLKKQMQKLKDVEAQLHDSPDQQISIADPMHAQWPRAAEAPERLATTYKQLSTTSTICSLPMR